MNFIDRFLPKNLDLKATEVIKSLADVLAQSRPIQLIQEQAIVMNKIQFFSDTGNPVSKFYEFDTEGFHKQINHQITRLFDAGYKHLIVVPATLFQESQKALKMLHFYKQFTDSAVNLIQEKIPVLHKVVFMNGAGALMIALGAIGKSYTKPDENNKRYAFNALIAGGLILTALSTHRILKTAEAFTPLLKTELALVTLN